MSWKTKIDVKAAALVLLMVTTSCGDSEDVAAATASGRSKADYGIQIDEAREDGTVVEAYHARLRERSKTPILIVRDFVRSNVGPALFADRVEGGSSPDIKPNGRWDGDLAEGFQVAVLALQQHPVWGEGCDSKPGHREGVFTHSLDRHLRSVIASIQQSDPGNEATKELERLLNALAELEVADQAEESQ